MEGIRVERLLAALSDRTRLRLLNLMGRDEICVCFFVEVLQTHQPKISRHLAYLRKAGIVSVRREGKWAHYKIVEPADARAAQVLKDVLAWIAEDPEMQRDRAQLESICCSTLPVPLRMAPRPRPNS